MPAFHEGVRNSLPRLTPDNYRISSPATWDYNCVAWAAGTTDSWWWPVPGRYWPEEIPREETNSAFVALFALLGFHPMRHADPETGIEKVVLYAKAGVPTHVARQLPSGWWTSKLGPNIDIEHSTPESVTGGDYGEVVVILGRQSHTG
jgi:hypothetical protein